MTKLSDITERKFIESFDIDEWEIETDTGWKDVTRINKTIEYEKWRIETESGLELICADTHIVFDENFEEVYVKDLIPYISLIKTKNGDELVIFVENLQECVNMYDLEIDSEDHRYYTNDILSHNTITTVAYCLWATLFQDNYSIAMLANKGALAKEILDRYQKAYANLPLWLQQGVVVFNKTYVELENQSKIIAAATSSSAIRGGSFNCFVGETLLHVEIDGEKIQQSMHSILQNSNNEYYIKDIKSTPHNELFLNNKYKTWYFNIITNAQTRNWTKKTAPVYTENHHIIPKSIGGNNDKKNLVSLTAKEHFIAHKLLIRCLSGANKSKMISALWLMISNTKHKKRYLNVSSKKYEEYRINHKKEFSIRKTGIPLSDTTKEKLSKSLKGNRLGTKMPTEIRKKISKALKGHKKTKEWTDKINKNPEKIKKTAEKHKGSKRTEESKQKMSIAKQGIIPWNKGIKGSMTLGKSWFHNKDTGKTIMCDPNNVPEGYEKGRK